jgi:heme-degrading monooxygenase HmoA
MIVERAMIDVLPGHEEEFERALAEAHGVIGRALGFRELHVLRGIERPGTYLLLIEWDRVEDHMIGFRESDLFVRWRELLGPHFERPPEVEHFRPMDDDQSEGDR